MLQNILIRLSELGKTWISLTLMSGNIHMINHYKKIVEDNRIFKFLVGLNGEFD